MNDWDGTDRRGGQRWKLKKEVSIGDLIAFCSAALAVVYAYTTLDKRVTVLEAAAITVKDAVRDRVGKYIKTRDGITRCWFNVTTSAFTHTTASGQLRIGNLPRTAENTSGMISVGTVQWQGITKASYTQITPKIEPNTAYIQFQASGSGQALSDVSAANMPTAGSVALIGMIEFRGAT